MKKKKSKPKIRKHNPATDLAIGIPLGYCDSHDRPAGPIPSTDLSQASLEQALIEFSDFCNKRGNKRIVLEPVIAVLKK